MTTLNDVTELKNETTGYVSRTMLFDDVHVNEFLSKKKRDKGYRTVRMSAWVKSLDACEIRDITTDNGTKTRTFVFKARDGKALEFTLFTED